MATGDPTGSDLASGTTNGDTLPVFFPDGPEERQIILNTGVGLLSGFKYAIIIKSAGIGSANRSIWQIQSPGTYSGGQRLNSTDSGSAWSGTSDDCWFKSFAGAALKDSYTPAGNAGASCFDTSWTAQVFTATSTYTITVINVELSRASGASPGTVTVSIRKVEGETYFAPPVITGTVRRLCAAANNKFWFENI